MHAYSAPIASQILEHPAATNPADLAPQGLLLEGMHAAWYNSANGAYFNFEQKALNAWLQHGGADTALTSRDSWSEGLLGNELLLLYEVTREPVYYDAATKLHSHLASVCATSPSPCMAQSYLAAYATAFQRDNDLSVIAMDFDRWLNLLRARAGTAKPSPPEASLLLMHARLLASLIDALPNFSRDPVDEQRLLTMFRAESDPSHIRKAVNGALRSAPDSSANADLTAARLLSVYAWLKGARLGYLPASVSQQTAIEWQHLTALPLPPDAGDGALLLAATEMDLSPFAILGRGQTVLLDAWFNSQQRRNAAGQLEYFHYKWHDYSDSGYSLLGHLFRSYGANTRTLYTPPTQENLTGAQLYLIASPDNPAKNPNSHYMTTQDTSEVAAWVRKGGLLVMLENDPANADISHLNLLADQFGIHFDNVLHHHILNDQIRGDHIEDGTIHIAGGGPIFHDPHTIYLKDTCAITVSASAQAILNDRGDVVMASAPYGKGMVFAMVDPWAYNEYTDGRKNPEVYGQFDNFAAATELVHWLLTRHSNSATPPK